MNSLTFFYSSMNAGKSLSLLTKNYTLEQKGFQTRLLKPSFDDRTEDKIFTRLGGISKKCDLIKGDELPSHRILLSAKYRPDFVFVDEAQFLKKEQVWDLGNLVDNWGIDVFTYGLKLNHKGEFFEGSLELMKISDNIEAIENICKRNKGAKAFYHIKTSGDINADQEVGFDDMYESVSRKSWKEWNSKN